MLTKSLRYGDAISAAYRSRPLPGDSACEALGVRYGQRVKEIGWSAVEGDDGDLRVSGWQRAGVRPLSVAWRPFALPHRQGVRANNALRESGVLIPHEPDLECSSRRDDAGAG